MKGACIRTRFEKVRVSVSVGAGEGVGPRSKFPKWQNVQGPSSHPFNFRFPRAFKCSLHTVHTEM